jgi:hypothetical protein
MGGLIARYALGLLADPKTCKVGGLNPEHFISIAAPHLGCCSDHPEEVSTAAASPTRYESAFVPIISYGVALYCACYIAAVQCQALHTEA